MILVPYFFILVLNSVLGGQVVGQIEGVNEAHCLKVRKALVGALGGEENINGSVSICQPRGVRNPSPEGTR